MNTLLYFIHGPPVFSILGPPPPPVQPFPPPTPPPPPPPPATVTPHWDAPLASGVTAIPTYLDQVNSVTMSRDSKTHDAVFARIRELGADHIRYLHWDPMPMSYPERFPPKDGKTSWDFSGIDPYVEDFMANTVGHDSVINFAPVGAFLTNSTGYRDPTGVAAGEYFSRIISWYTKGGFVDELGIKHISNHTYDWKYWEVLNEVDAGESGTHCHSLNNSLAAPQCARKYTEIYDGIVTVLHRDHPQLQFTGLVTAWPDCAGSEAWFSYFLNASNHRSPVRENFGTYVHEVSYHWYSENGAAVRHTTPLYDFIYISVAMDESPQTEQPNSCTAFENVLTPCASCAAAGVVAHGRRKPGRCVRAVGTVPRGRAAHQSARGRTGSRDPRVL